MNLETNYLGFKLAHPLIVGACPLSDTLDGLRRVEAAGASAVVLRSLFEEQITAESMAHHRAMESHADSHGEASSYFVHNEDFKLGPDEYLEHIRNAKSKLTIPVFASLNGDTPGRWIEYAKLIEQAGADALELNMFHVPVDPGESGSFVEKQLIDVVAGIRKAVKLPLAIKLSPFYTAPANLAAQLEKAGANALVVFNRFYEPDVSVEKLEIESHLHLSTSTELALRLRWLAILSGQVKTSLAVTGGVHSAIDALKAVMCGAHAVQLVSVLLGGGLAKLRMILHEMTKWLQDHEYESLRQALGSMNRTRCPNPGALERGNYVHMLQTWQLT
ncbi:MAG: dihydroorotate dehydrogenase-like protein [Planctomycetes bacterium]|nr:dihydroorotate dehydrogenase-like protein [Planctomycetota bacterium]